MIYDGALAANGVIPVANWFWAAIIGVLIILDPDWTYQSWKAQYRCNDRIIYPVTGIV